MSTSPNDQGVNAKPMVAPSELRRRITDAIEIHNGMDRPSAPDNIPEVPRELQMLQGAMQGVEQRVGELAAVLQPVLHPKSLAALHSPREPLHSGEFELETTVGKQLRELQDRISEVEEALAHLAHGTRL